MANKKKIVLDASVLLKWFLKEENSSLAREFLGYFKQNIIDISVPELVFFETINVLRYKSDYSLLKLKKVAQVLSNFQLDVILWNEEWYSYAIDYAYLYGLTIYDSSYLAIARSKKLPFITADGKMYSKIQPKENEHLLKELTVDRIKEMSL